MSKYVVHCKHEPYDVYIGRPSKWGNPYILGINGSRSEVVAKFKSWLMSDVRLIEQAKAELRGKILGCWCAPKVCHGDVLAVIANEEATN